MLFYGVFTIRSYSILLSTMGSSWDGLLPWFVYDFVRISLSLSLSLSLSPPWFGRAGRKPEWTCSKLPTPELPTCMWSAAGLAANVTGALSACHRISMTEAQCSSALFWTRCSFWILLTSCLWRPRSHGSHSKLLKAVLLELKCNDASYQTFKSLRLRYNSTKCRTDRQTDRQKW